VESFLGLETRLELEVKSGLSLIPVLFALPARDSPFLESLLYEFEEPFVVDHSKFEEAFSEQATPLRESIQRSVRWYREERPAET
jgi:hypothetical protein